MRLAALSLGLLLATSTAHADQITDPPPPAATDDQLVLLNASSWIGSIDQIARIRRVLDQRGLLAKLPQRLEATLDGRNALLQDLDAIKLAYGKQDYATARKLIERDELRVLSGASGTDPMPALAQLSELSGLVAAAEEHPDEAVAWFRAAYRFNPAQSPEKQLTSPRVRAIIKKARTEPASTGKLRIDADPDIATIQIDGGKLQPVTEKLDLPVGFHLVQIAAAGRKSYAALVEIHEGGVEKLAIALAPETQQDKAAKLVDATVAAPAGSARFHGVQGLSRLTGVNRMLVVEEGADDHVTLRVYDVETRKVSRPLELAGSASSATIAHKILAALDPENMMEARTATVSDGPTKWYAHWYVWAGVALLAGGGLATYEYLGRGPTSIRGF